MSNFFFKGKIESWKIQKETTVISNLKITEPLIQTTRFATQFTYVVSQNSSNPLDKHYDGPNRNNKEPEV